MTATVIVRGINAHNFASSNERDSFLKTVKFTEDGLLEKGTDYAKIVGSIGGVVGDDRLTPRFVQSIVGGSLIRDEMDAQEAQAGLVEIIPCRNGEGYNVYRGGQGDRKFLVYIGADTVSRVHSLSDQLDAMKTSGTERYYSARDSYEITRGKNRGEMAPAEPAVVVKVDAGGLATRILHSGSAADDYAKAHKLLPVNNPPKPAVNGK